MKTFLSASEKSTVKDIVTRAGKKLLKVKDARVLESKHVGFLSTSTVTQSDIDTENFLREKFVRQFPTFGFYGEESAKESPKELEKEFVWVVDPIDGTLNFSRGLPFWGISVALLHSKVPVVGVIYFPREDALYWAEKGKGTHVGQKQSHCAHRGIPQELYAVISHKGLSPEKAGNLHRMFAAERLHVRGVGSASYHIAHVASGQYDLIMGLDLALWDYVAGWLLVEEAGGVFHVVGTDEAAREKGDPYHVWYVAGSREAVDWITPKLRAFSL